MKRFPQNKNRRKFDIFQTKQQEQHEEEEEKQ